jgi:hypothetical protein
MRKLISLLSAACLALVLCTASAKAGCLPIHESSPYGTVNGQVCMSPGNVSFTGTVTTAAGKTYTITATGTASGSYPNVSVSGQVTITDGTTVVQTVTVTGTGQNLLIAAVGFINKTITLVPQS